MEIPKKPRFLCLHGHASNVDRLKEHLNVWPDYVLEKMDLVFINGPFSVDDGPLEDELLFKWFTMDMVFGCQSAFGGVRLVLLALIPFSYPWKPTLKLECTQSQLTLDTKTYENFDEGIAYIEDRIVELGPFDGVLGFSQGAIVTGALPGMQEQGVCLTNVGKIEHVIIISGAKLGGRTFPAPKLAETAFSSPIDIPSLHIFGENDVARTNAPELVEAYVDPLVIYHHGGHEVPELDEEGLKIMFEFLEKINATVDEEVLLF